ncbi:MAG: hypothetical protein QNJ85_18380 [Gammaproteobacteria bacterium]|nr:hypothetical protein [Gammaproteobacteria bacterium]
MKHRAILGESTAVPLPAAPSTEREPIDDVGLTGADWERRIILSRMHQLEQENRELKRANEILRRAAAYFSRPAADNR